MPQRQASRPSPFVRIGISLSLARCARGHERYPFSAMEPRRIGQLRRRWRQAGRVAARRRPVALSCTDDRSRIQAPLLPGAVPPRRGCKDHAGPTWAACLSLMAITVTRGRLARVPTCASWSCTRRRGRSTQPRAASPPPVRRHALLQRQRPSGRCRPLGAARVRPGLDPMPLPVQGAPKAHSWSDTPKRYGVQAPRPSNLVVIHTSSHNLP